MHVRFHPARFRVLDAHCPWLRSIAALFPFGDRLFLYLSKRSGAVMLGLWAEGFQPEDPEWDTGLFTPLEQIGVHPNHPGARIFGPAYAINRLAPKYETFRAIRRNLLSADRKEAERRRAADAYRRESSKFWRKKGEREMADAIDRAAIPLMGPEEAHLLGFLEGDEL